VPESVCTILYDGICGLCNRFVTFVLARDHRSIFSFAPLQSRFASQALARYGKDSTKLDTIYVVVDSGQPNEELLAQSEAVLFVLTRLQATGALARVLRIVPRCLADWLYNQVATRRYRLFGRLTTCRIPSEEQRTRFIEM
jgi:predicted DCC family thiol-disulfide oxidoreductase YuxK